MASNQASFRKRLKALMNLPENQVCSDCPERQPRWASLIVPPPGSPPGSLPIGAFCCLECSGSHRRLGVHISFVRSITLDSWKEHEVLAMENGGNQKVNAIFEAGLDPHSNLKPTTHASGSVRERFIRDKYERRKYYDASIMQKYHSGELQSESSSEDESSSSDEENSNERIKTAPVTVRAPSEAARIRAEQRKQRLATSGKIGEKNSKPIMHPKARSVRPPNVKTTINTQPEVDLLDFGNLSTGAGPPPNPPSAAPSPTLDLFRDVKTLDTSKNGQHGSHSGLTQSSTSTPTTESSSSKSSASPSQTHSNKMSSDDILAMFHAPAPTFNNGGNANSNHGQFNAPMGTHIQNGNSMNNMMQINNMRMNNMMQSNVSMSNTNNNNMMQMNSGNMMQMNNNANMMQMNAQMQNMYLQQQQVQQTQQQPMNNMMGSNNGSSGAGMVNSQNNKMGMNQTNQIDNSNQMMMMQAPMGGTPSNLSLMGGTATGGNVGNMTLESQQQTASNTASLQNNPQVDQFAQFGSFR